MKSLKEQEKKDAIKYLKSVIKKDSELLVSISSVSSSGMTRKMDVFVIGKVKRSIYENKSSSYKIKITHELMKLNWYLERAGIVKRDKNSRCIVHGCGMDMAFHLTYTIKCKLFESKEGLNNQQYRVI